tara:strand:+ start:1253 stop:2413 length:1161 start_codon:yes stop_codon:yes gene_type:complete
MAKLLKLRRGTTSEHSSFTGAEGEVTIDTTKDTAVVHDGSTAGGHPLVKENAEVTSTGIASNVVDEDNLKVSNTPTNGQYLQAQSGASGGLTWAAVSQTPEGTAVLSTGESGGTKFLREDGDGSSSWQAIPVPTEITVTAENTTAATVYPTFVGNGASSTGNLDISTDTGFTYNPSTGDLTATKFTGAATALHGSRTIGGVVFDNTANINLPGVNAAGNQDTTGNSATATTATNVTVADESSDTSCNVLYTTAATGDLAPKSGTNLTFNSADGTLTSTKFADTKGSLRSIPYHSGYSSVTLTADMAGHVVNVQSNCTVPNSVFATGDTITIVNEGAGNCTITQGSGFTLYSSADGSTGNKTLAAKGICTIWWRTSGYAFMSGSGLS